MSEPPPTANWPAKLVVSPMMYRLCVRHWGEAWCEAHLVQSVALPRSSFDDLDRALFPEKHQGGHQAFIATTGCREAAIPRDLGSRDRRFKSCLPDWTVVQRLEHISDKDETAVQLCPVRPPTSLV